jgi:hypothetical protein
MPRVINASCDDSRRLALGGANAVLFYGSLCSNIVTGDTIIARYGRLKLPSLRPVTDSIRVDIVLPARPARTPGGAPT